MKKLLLVDGYSMLFRAYHATSFKGPIMSTKNGIPTNAIFGFANMLQKGIEMIQPDAVMVAFDSGKKNFRHELYADYKGQRKPADEALVVQFPIVREYLDAINVTWYEQDGIEGDDIVGSMIAQNPDWEINVLSSDRDLLQLINPHASILLMKKGLTEFALMDEAGLKEAYGLKPYQIIDMKGLMGDASDNIPGIPKVGEKTATSLLQQYDTLENVLDHVDELKGKLQENVRTYADQARLSKTLATIRTDCHIPVTPEMCTYELNVRDAYDFYVKYELNSFIKKLDLTQLTHEDAPQAQSTKPELQVTTQLPEGFFHEPTAMVVDVDFEKYSIATVYGLSFANQHGLYYMDIQDAQNDTSITSWLQSDQTKILLLSKNDYHYLRNYFPSFEKGIFDVQIANFLVHGNGSSFTDLVEYHGLSMKQTMEDIYGKPNKPMLPDLTMQHEYASDKAYAIYSLYKTLKDKIEELDMHALYYDMEIPLSHILFEMEDEGIRVDETVLDRIAEETNKKMQVLSEEIYLYAGETFNINSPAQLGNILYDKMKLATGKKRSTAADVLEKLLPAHPIIGLILEYRKYQKLFSTYGEGLKKYIGTDRKIHTQFNQCVTQTGRLSSTEPNLQNISIRSEEGREVRKAFLPEDGCVLMSADYSNVELRMLAHMAQEPALIDAFRNNMDVHTKTAMDVFHVAKEEVDPLMRRRAKAVNFGIVYGISDFGLSEQLDISRKEAQQYIDTYFASYPNIASYMDRIVKDCERDGYVKTICNRRREILEIQDKNYMKREFGKRAAMNAPIQGSAADLIKLAMIHVAERMKKENMKSKMLLQVHDELVFNVPMDEREQMKRIIEEEMSHAMELSVPLVAECVEGTNWYEAK